MGIPQKLSFSVVGLLVAVLAGAAPALAETHPFVTSFGSLTNPNGIAVEESTGDVYVADIATNTVSKFDASGNPVEFSALHSNVLNGSATPAGSFLFPETTGTPAAIAVDNSRNPSDPSAGDLYVMDAGHEAIDKFNANGEYLGQIAGHFSAGRFPGELWGFGVEANGDIRVADYRAHVEGSAGPQAIWELFDDSAANNLITTVTDFSGGREGLVVGPSGDSYVLDSEGCGCWTKFGGSLVGGLPANDETLGRVDSGPGDVAAGADPVSGHLYVDDQASVAEWDTGGMNGLDNNAHDGPVSTATLVSSFSSMGLSSSPAQQGGIAVDGATGDIYVSSPANGKVYEFASTTPAVAAGVVANVSETGATLQGSVDPRGVPVDSCEFEYEQVPEGVEVEVNLLAPAAVFSHKVPCAQSAAQIGSGASPVGVSADVGGLVPGTLNDFRLVASNADGTSPSEGRFPTVGSGFGVKSFEVSFLNQDGTPDTRAGSHPYKMVTSFTFKTTVRRESAGMNSPYVSRPDGSPKDIVVVPPPGLVGDPNATASKCTLRELEGGFQENNAGHCPPGSEVGELSLRTDGYGAEESVFNMVAPRGVAAQFGANFRVPKAFINVGLQTGGNYPVQAESLDIPAVEAVNKITTTLFGEAGQAAVRKAEEAVREGKEGAAAELEEAIRKRKPFLTLPTGCAGPLRSSISMDSYQQPGHFVGMGVVTHDSSGQPLSLTGCSKLQFPPTIAVAPDVTDASTPSGLTVDVHVPQTAALNPEGLAESALRDTTVTLPAGMAINPAGADGLQGCSEGLAGFGVTEEGKFVEFTEYEPGTRTARFTPTPIESLQPGVSFCSDASKIGTVKLRTPLLTNALEGAVYVATQNENPFGSLIAMYMLIEDPVSGSTVKLAGEVRLCESAGDVLNGVSCQAPGQIVTTFENTPDLPFEELELHFFGGERAPLRTPARCGTYTTNASFTPWDGNAPVNTSSSFQITSGPNGSPCPGASLPFSPSLSGGTTNVNAGSFSPLTTTISRADGQQELQSVQLHMPPGLSGLLSGVKLCPEAQANEGTCGQESLIGETTVSAGVGSDPVSVKGGKVYLTEKYAGAPFGLSIVNPVKAGPFDLEHDTANPAQQPACDCVVVRAKIDVDPTTAALTVTTDSSGPHAIPHFIDGVPVEIKAVNVIVNREHFTFNPTNCSPLLLTGTIGSDEGASSPVSIPFQATNCAILRFAPKFTVSTSGRTNKSLGASLTATVSEPAGAFGTQANISLVKVELPKQLPSRLTTLQKACLAAVFDANPANCPPASVIGHAKVITPLLPVPLEGPAIFVSHGGEAFPSLTMVLQGYGVIVDLVGTTFISKEGITSTTFKTVPDTPFNTFSLTLPEGKFSALAANGDLCAATKTVTVKRRVALKRGGRVVRRNGKAVHVTRKVKQQVSTTLAVPNEFVGQNGMVIQRLTLVTVTGCPKTKKATKHKHKGKKGRK